MKEADKPEVIRSKEQPLEVSDEPPVVARLIVEIRSDGTRTIARGAIEDVASGQKTAIDDGPRRLEAPDDRRTARSQEVEWVDEFGAIGVSTCADAAVASTPSIKASAHMRTCPSSAPSHPSRDGRYLRAVIVTVTNHGRPTRDYL